MSGQATRRPALRTLACAAVLVVSRPLSGAAGAQAPDGGGPSDNGGTTATGDRPRPFAALSASATSMRDSVVALARAQVGRRYRFGGTTPERGFDCSGLVRYVLANLQLEVPRTASQQDRAGVPVARDTSGLRPGDLLTFGNGRKATHVGIYIGNGRYIHASSKAGRVIESPLNRAPHPLIKKWRGARRLVVTPDSSIAIQPSPISG